ncbi:hypothetical protein ASG33_25025 [Dyadobacter sp. Leaf189]|nr:hypothetical protein ASG33_25025 [Dyadobacter sp. Leaf189]
MSNIKTFKRPVSGIIILLVITRVALSFFLYRELMFRSPLPLILDASILLFLVLLGLIKYQAGERLSSNPMKILGFVLVGLLIYIFLTRQTHQKQVEALNEIIKTSNSE